MINKKIIFFGASSLASEHLVYDLSKKNKIYNISRNKINGLNNIFVDFNNESTFENLNKIKEKKIDYLIYFSSKVPPSEFNSKWDALKKINVYSLIKILIKLNLEIKKIILASSMSVYGTNIKKKIDEFSRTNPDTAYALSKFTQEKIFRIYSKVNNIKFLCLRLGYIYSENISSKRLIKKIILKISKNQDLTIINGDKINLNLLHTKDLSITMKKLIKKRQGIFNLSTNQFISVNFFIKKVLKYFPKYKGKIIKINDDNIKKDFLFSNKKINSIHDFDPIKRLDSTIEKIVKKI